jgi:hypothetical protein
MLPGFRFLFAAIVLSMSIMVFGLGAAALFRAAHEEFASNPSWRPTPETSFAQQGETTRPVLAMLRIDQPPAEPKIANNVPVAAAIAAPVEPVEPATQPSMPAEPEKTAALTSDDSAPTEAAKPETLAQPEIQAQPDIQAVENKAAETKATDATPPTEVSPADAPAPIAVAGTGIATAEQASPPANVVAAAVSEQASIAVSPDAPAISTKIATLGGPAFTIEAAASAAAKAASTKKRVQARRAARRRRLLAQQRARVMAQTIQAANPFAPTPVATQRP